MASTQDKSAKQLAYDKFENVFKNTLIEQILGHAKKYKLPEEYLAYFEKVSAAIIYDVLCVFFFFSIPSFSFLSSFPPYFGHVLCCDLQSLVQF
jgi:hypothetical protein